MITFLQAVATLTRIGGLAFRIVSVDFHIQLAGFVISPHAIIGRIYTYLL